jgi:hypothetical protein
VFLGFSKGAEQNVLRGLGQLRSKISDNLPEQLVAHDLDVGMHGKRRNMGTDSEQRIETA